MKYVKTKEEGFVRDVNSKAIVCTDDEYKKFQLLRRQKRSEKTIQEQINTLNKEVSELKIMIQTLLGKDG